MTKDGEEFMKYHRYKKIGEKIHECLNCPYFKLNPNGYYQSDLILCTHNSDKGVRIRPMIRKDTDGRPRQCPLNTQNDILKMDIKNRKKYIESLNKTIKECNRKIKNYEKEIKEMEEELCTE